MHEPPRHPSRLAVLLVILLSSGMAYYHLGIYLPRAIQHRVELGLGGGYAFGDDFYPIWLTTRVALLRHQSPYAPETTRAIQMGIFGRSLDSPRPNDPPPDYRAFAYPAYVDLLFWPLSLLSFPVVRVLLAIALTVLTAASVLLWLRFLRLQANSPLLVILILFTLSSYGVIEGLFAAQLGLLVGFLLASSFAALAANRLFLAGSLLSLTFIKPQMSAIVAVYLVIWTFSDWRQRRSFVFGLAGWSTVLATASLIVWPHWIAQWLHILSGYGGYSYPPLIVYSLGPSFGPRVGSFLVAVLLVAAIILMWKMRNIPALSPRFSVTVCLLLAITAIAIVPGQAVHDQVILLPGIFLIAWTWRRLSSTSLALRVVVAATPVALFWQWIVAASLLALQYFIPPARFFTNSVLLLPFAAAATVPILVFVTLAYMMMKAIRERRSQGEI